MSPFPSGQTAAGNSPEPTSSAGLPSLDGRVSDQNGHGPGDVRTIAGLVLLGSLAGAILLLLLGKARRRERDPAKRSSSTI
jgi:hypothetical protein